MPRRRNTVILERIKLVLALACMAGMAYVFTFYLDSDIGVVVCAFLILAPLLSVLLAWIAARHVTVTLSAPDCLPKGRHFTVKLHAVFGARLPVPFLRVKFAQEANFAPDDPRAVQSAMTFTEPLDMEHGLKALYAGRGLVGAETLYVSDYLGLAQFPVKDAPGAVRIGVIPLVPELTGAGVMLRTVNDIVMTDDEEEETNVLYASQSTPGYIHRDYFPGDDLRRINWKMSAKRRKLMIRMDEAASTVRPTLVLDLAPQHDAPGLALRERMMEGALGLLRLLVRQGIVCSLRYPTDGGWTMLPLDTEDSVQEAAVALADADFSGDGQRIDPGVRADHAGAVIVFTSMPDAALDAALGGFKDCGTLLCVCPVMEPLPTLANADALWQMDDSFGFTSLRK
ncbi:MAG: DUF58 domain-containing protein [Oscillospiraceae bacterium]|nr:DUF58 domain-containing protein [Oscillospiraceae bacterium]